MYNEKTVECMSCGKPLFQILINHTSIDPIKYSSNCPYCDNSSFSATERSTYVSVASKSLFLISIDDISQQEKKIVIGKSK